MAPDELAYTSTRTSADSYADTALDDLLSHVTLHSTRTQCYTRDALAEAFEVGEHQGLRRAIIILSIARANATDAAARLALGACLKLLVPEISE